MRSGAPFDQEAGLAPSEPTPAGEAQPVQPSAAPLGFEEWFSMMHAGFGAASFVTKLQSLAWSKDDPRARPAFQALYDTCAEIPALGFLLRPGGKWLGRAMAVGMFVMPMAQAVRAEVAAKRGGGVLGAPANDKAASPAAPMTAQVLPAGFADAVKAA